MKKPPFVNNEIYHIYNRGVDKRKIFIDDQDRIRFIHDLFEFNDEYPAENFFYFKSKNQYNEVEPRYIERQQSRKLIVDILAFCEMPNHYHLMIRQRADNGIINFMQKLGTGYTMYFNQKYKRSGSLFQGRFKAVLIKEEQHFIHLPYYIHLNPLDLITPKWRERILKNPADAMKFLEEYKWSSYQDYIGKNNFPSVTQREFLLNFFGETKTYKKEMINWLNELNSDQIKEITLE